MRCVDSRYRSCGSQLVSDSSQSASAIRGCDDFFKIYLWFLIKESELSYRSKWTSVSGGKLVCFISEFIRINISVFEVFDITIWCQGWRGKKLRYFIETLTYNHHSPDMTILYHQSENLEYPHYSLWTIINDRVRTRYKIVHLLIDSLRVQ